MDFIQTLILKCSERVWNCRFHLFFMKYSNDVIKLSNILKTNPKLTLTIQYQVLFQINNKRWRSSFLQSKEIEKEYSIAICLSTVWDFLCCLISILNGNIYIMKLISTVRIDFGGYFWSDLSQLSVISGYVTRTSSSFRHVFS